MLVVVGFDKTIGSGRLGGGQGRVGRVGRDLRSDSRSGVTEEWRRERG